jgi:BirA family biotin operon repressor/biotin-[acetyl-CoA-carboxylase] ligase
MTWQTVEWDVEPLWQQLEPLLPGLTIEVVALCDSTNTQLLDRARGRGDADGLRQRAADRQPCLLVAERQTQGRGRFGRSWQSSAGASLTFSLALALDRHDLSGLSLAVGVALAEALDASGSRVRVKWPNDLWLVDRDGARGGRKLGGVLIETTSVGERRWVVIGVGINVAPQRLAGEPTTATACLHELDAAATPASVLGRVAPALVGAIVQFEHVGFAPFAARFAARDALRGQAVVTASDGSVAGEACGVDAHGALIVQTAQGVVALSSGEVSVRFAAQTQEH